MPTELSDLARKIQLDFHCLRQIAWKSSDFAVNQAPGLFNTMTNTCKEFCDRYDVFQANTTTPEGETPAQVQSTKNSQHPDSTSITQVACPESTSRKRPRCDSATIEDSDPAQVDPLVGRGTIRYMAEVINRLIENQHWMSGRISILFRRAPESSPRLDAMSRHIDELSSRVDKLASSLLSDSHDPQTLGLRMPKAYGKAAVASKPGAT